MKLPYPLILASTSKYRSALLAQLGWPFQSISPEVDEEQYKRNGLPPLGLAQALAKLKAETVFKNFPQSCVLGSDQVCVMGEEILSKPGSVEKGILQLEKMQGSFHELITAVTIISPSGELSFHNRTVLHMRKLTASEIKKYIEEDMPLDCAGSYKLESKGIKLFEKIEMDDHTSIIGLPLIQLNNQLLKLGYPL